jgi:cytochrome b6-f complex iron-sulfur subunit
MELTRRFLLSWLLGGSLVAFFANLLWQMAKFLKPPPELISGGGGGKVTVIPLADLPVDHAKVVRHEGKLVIVVHQKNEVYALSAVCTHLGCIVHWKDKGDPGMKMGDNLHCACHDAFFDLKSGKVLGGPAPRPLQTYPVKLTADQIVIGEA